MKNKLIYWITTGIVAVMMLLSAFGYLTAEEMKAAFVHLGFPSYFRIELAIAKILGAVVLLVPGIPGKIKEFAYFGFATTFVSAFIAHLSSNDPIPVSVIPLIVLVILLVSYFYYHKLSNGNK